MSAPPATDRRGLLRGLLAGSILGASAPTRSEERTTTPVASPDRRCIIDAGWALLHDGQGLALQRDVSIVIDGVLPAPPLFPAASV